MERRISIKELVRQPQRQRYQSSVLGFLWTMLNPLLVYISFCIIFPMTAAQPLNSQGLRHLLTPAVTRWWTFFANTNFAGRRVRRSRNCWLRDPDQYAQGRLSTCQRGRQPGRLCCQFCDSDRTDVLSMEARFFVRLSRCPRLAVLLAVPSPWAQRLLTARWTVLLRDFRQLLGSSLFIWFFFCPILSRATVIPQNVRFYFYLNPISALPAPVSSADLGRIPTRGVGLSCGGVVGGCHRHLGTALVLPIGKSALLLRV